MAVHLLDSYVYGHVIQETSMSGPTADEPEPDPPADGEALGTDYPHLAEMAAHAGGSAFSFDGEFDHGLEIILGALEPAASGTADV